MRWLAVLLALMVAGCATKMGKDGRTQTTFDAKYLVKSDVDRIADADRAEVVAGLLLIADKLYKRNPKEWKKGAAVSREAREFWREPQHTSAAVRENNMVGAGLGMIVAAAFVLWLPWHYGPSQPVTWWLAAIAAAVRTIRSVYVAPVINDYIVAISEGTRRHPDLRLGASPRSATSTSSRTLSAIKSPCPCSCPLSLPHRPAHSHPAPDYGRADNPGIMRPQ